MKICFLISSLRSGGAERVVSLLANSFSKKYDVEILTWEDSTPFYTLEAKVKHIPLNLQYVKEKYKNNLYFNLVRIKALRSVLKERKPTVVISFIITNNILAILASRKLGISVLISERSALFTNKISKFWFNMRKLTYKYADLLVFQSQNAADLGIANKIVAKRNVVISNPISIEPKQDIPKQDVVLFVGRLSKEKQVKNLIQAFKNISALNPTFQLWIVGDGPEKENLIQLSGDLIAKERIVFFGQQTDTELFYQKAKIFVLPSLSEGFPNVLLEAMNFNNIVISSNYSKAVEEIIEDGTNGFLYGPNDVAKLEMLLSDVMKRYELHGQCAANAHDGLAKYSIENITNEWEQNLQKVLKENGGQKNG